MMEVKMLGVLDVLSMLVAGSAAMECAVGRIGAMDRRKHRPLLMLGYFMAAMVCLAGTLAPLDGVRSPVLQILATAVAVHLVLTWEDWRHGPPASAVRDDLPQLAAASADNHRDDAR
jgi:hypothetical protein